MLPFRRHVASRETELGAISIAGELRPDRRNLFRDAKKWWWPAVCVMHVTYVTSATWVFAREERNEGGGANLSERTAKIVCPSRANDSAKFSAVDLPADKSPSKSTGIVLREVYSDVCDTRTSRISS